MTDQDAPDAVLAELIWQQTGRLRNAAHRVSGQLRCPGRTAPYGLDDPLGERLSDDCRVVGCLDVVHELFAVVGSRLAARTADDVPAAVEDPTRFAHTVVSHEVAELQRRLRLQRGLPAKPTRSDGPARRIDAVLASSAPDEATAAWRVSLFAMMRAYACRLDRTSARWPAEAWAAEKRDRFPQLADGPDGSDAVAADVEAVLAIGRRVGGEAWVYANLTHPLLAAGRPRSVDELELRALAGPDGDADWSVFCALYREQRAGGRTRADALRVAFGRVFGEAGPGRLVTAEVGRILDELERPGPRSAAAA